MNKLNNFALSTDQIKTIRGGADLPEWNPRIGYCNGVLTLFYWNRNTGECMTMLGNEEDCSACNE